MTTHARILNAILAPALSAAVASASATMFAFPVGAEPGGLTFDPVLRHAFVTSTAEGTLSEIGADTLAITTLPIGTAPRELVANAVLHRVYIVHDTAPGYVTVFNPLWNAPERRIYVGDGPRHLAADFARGTLYVSNHDSDSVSVIDLASGRVAATIAVDRNPGPVAVNPVLGRVYVVSATADRVTLIDQETATVLATVRVGRHPGAATVDERTGKVYVNNVDDATVSVLDGSDGALVATIAVGRGSTAGTVSAIYHRYYLPNADDGTLSVIDTDLDALVRTVPVGDAPTRAVIDAEAGTIYVANRVGGDIAVLDARDDAYVTRMPALGSPAELAVDMQRLFVLNGDGTYGTVGVLPRLGDGQRTAIATEYHDAASDRYLAIIDPLEKRLVADGIDGAGWQGTMQFWRVWAEPAPGRVRLCELSGGTAGEGWRFITPYSLECALAKAATGEEEEPGGHYVALPSEAGACGRGTVPLYRLYQPAPGGLGNHRYLIDPSIGKAMRAAGWVAEGVGPDAVFACVPAPDGPPATLPRDVRPTTLPADTGGPAPVFAGPNGRPPTKPK